MDTDLNPCETLWSRLHRLMSRETFKMALVQFRIGAFIKCVPFELESRESLRVRLYSSRWRQALWHLFHMVYYFHTIFLLVTFALTLAKKPFDTELTMHLMYVIVGLYGFVFMLSCYLKPVEFVFMLNTHDFVFKAVAGMGISIPHWTSHFFVIVAIYYFAFGLFGLWCAQGAMYIWNPRSARYLFHYLPAEWQYTWTFLLVLAYELAWTAWYLTSMGLFFCYWCADIYTINSITAKMMTKAYTTAEDMKLYEYLQLFTMAFNDFNGTVFTVGFTTMLVVTPIIFIYISLAMYDSLMIIVYMAYPIAAGLCVFLIMFFLPQHAKVGILSGYLVKILRTRRIKDQCGMEGERTRKCGFEEVMAAARSRLIIKKRARAFAPLGIRIWFFGIYTLTTSQELMIQLCNNVLLLLSL